MNWKTTADGHLAQGFEGDKPVAVIVLEKPTRKRFRFLVSCEDPKHLAEVMDKAKEIVKGATA